MNDLITQEPTAQLVADWLASTKPNTLLAYHQGLNDFAKFTKLDVNESAKMFLALNHGQANHLVLNYKNDMLKRKLSAATINQRLCALRSLVRLARTLGVIPWTIDIKGLKTDPIRDSTGPGHEGVKLVLNVLASKKSPRYVRNRAIIRLLFDRALRRSEVCSLDLEHIDLERNRIFVLEKGKTERKWMTIAPETAAAIADWIAKRGQEPGPLFIALRRLFFGNRLTGDCIYSMLERLGRLSFQVLRPHGLRHAAITRALDLCNGDVRKVQKFSRHAQIATVLLYDDNRKDFGGEVTRLLAGDT